MGIFVCTSTQNKEMLEKAKEAPDGNDATKGIALNTMVFFYLQPDFKFDIVGNHDTVFSKAGNTR